MTHEDLIDKAEADALGLLPEYEASMYTRAFHGAPVSLQRRIRKLQADYVIGAAAALGDVEPGSDDLRARTMKRVARSMQKAHEPIGKIGGRSRQRSGRESGRPFGFLRNFGNAAVWRAATFILTGAVAVLGYFHFEAKDANDRLSKFLVLQEGRAEVTRQIGPEAESFYRHPDKVAKVLRPEDDSYPGHASVHYYTTRTGELHVMIVATGLPQSDDEYTIEAHRPDGRVVKLDTMLSDGYFNALRLENITHTLLASATFVIRDPSGSVVLST